jgi:hypothetical protein
MFNDNIPLITTVQGDSSDEFTFRRGFVSDHDTPRFRPKDRLTIFVSIFK